MTPSLVTRAWRDAFITEMRLRGADGHQIGDELAQVESHCLDADTPAEEAFGDPTDYARSVVVAGDDDSPVLSLGEGRRLVVSTVIQFVGLTALASAVIALRNGTQVTFTGVSVVLAVVLVGMLVVVVTKADAVLRLLVDRSTALIVVASTVLVLVLAGVAVLLAPLLTAFSFTVPAAAAAVVGVLLLLTPSVVNSSAVREDLVVPPSVDGAPAFDAAPPAHPRWSMVMLRWWVPAAGLVYCALLWMVA